MDLQYTSKKNDADLTKVFLNVFLNVFCGTATLQIGNFTF